MNLLSSLSANRKTRRRVVLDDSLSFDMIGCVQPFLLDTQGAKSSLFFVADSPRATLEPIKVLEGAIESYVDGVCIYIFASYSREFHGGGAAALVTG